jgi:hypothetical protein
MAARWSAVPIQVGIDLLWNRVDYGANRWLDAQPLEELLGRLSPRLLADVDRRIRVHSLRRTFERHLQVEMRIGPPVSVSVVVRHGADQAEEDLLLVRVDLALQYPGTLVGWGPVCKLSARCVQERDDGGPATRRSPAGEALFELIRELADAIRRG